MHIRRQHVCTFTNTPEGWAEFAATWQAEPGEWEVWTAVTFPTGQASVTLIEKDREAAPV